MKMILETTTPTAGLKNLADIIRTHGRRMGWREVIEAANRQPGLGVYQGGSHVAVHATDAQGKIVAPRLAIIL